MYRQFAGVLLVLGVLIGCLWLLKRRGFVRFTGVRGESRPDRVVTVIERVPLGAQHALHVLQIGRRRVLISSSPGSCQLITEISASDVPREVSR